VEDFSPRWWRGLFQEGAATGAPHMCDARGNFCVGNLRTLGACVVVKVLVSQEVFSLKEGALVKRNLVHRDWETPEFAVDPTTPPGGDKKNLRGDQKRGRPF